MPYVRTGKAGAAFGVVLLIIVYIVGLNGESWVVVHKYDFTGQVIGNMGLFKACGYNTTLHAPKDGRTKNKCFSLFEPGVPGWVRAVQFFAIFDLCLLIILSILWAFVLYFRNITDKNVKSLVIGCWSVTGIFLLVHPIIFACHIRPSSEVEEHDTTLFRLYDKTVITTMYWGSFYLHCIVAGFVNFISLIITCCMCAFYGPC